MARPKTKDELLFAAEDNFQKLNNYISDLNTEAIHSDFPEGTLNRNVRDLLAHLYHWHVLFLGWYKVGMNGEKPAIPEEGYTWKTTPELNRWIQQHYCQTPLADIEIKLAHSHSTMIDLITKLSDEELFEKKRYPWTGSTSLGAYLISATSSHYDWALKLIKRARK